MAVAFKTDILLVRDPSTSLQAATKQYVDNSITALSTGAVIDGGSATTSSTGLFMIDFGKAT